MKGLKLDVKKLRMFFGFLTCCNQLKNQLFFIHMNVLIVLAFAVNIFIQMNTKVLLDVS